MIGHRKAAALLHGLHGEDRRWILQNLAKEDRDILDQCLSEMTELGFTSEPVSSRENLFGIEQNTVASPDERVANARADSVYEVLRNEPVQLIAKVLLVRRWKWAEEVLGKFQELTREHIRKQLDHATQISPALSACLVKELSVRLQQSRVEQANALVNVMNSDESWFRRCVKRAPWNR